MQNRYSGDVGDFGKFGLLRYLLNNSKYSLGINWYLFPDEGHNEDGKFTEYLSKPNLKPNFEKCDSELHNKLKTIVENNKRCVQALKESNLFKCKTTYFSMAVDFYPNFPGQTRLSLRKEWQDKATAALAVSNVLFIDPDNGLQIKSCESLNQKKSGKYAYFTEISKFHEDKEFTVIYHHLNRCDSHSQQIKNRAQELKDKINPKHTVFCIRYRPYSPRAFFIIASPNAIEYVRDKLKAFLKSSWEPHWDCYHEI
ncbi:hypothetical protein MNB_SUP05-SYMBIONT-5-435 [hydrothermal vent metagenome]|uniref:Uncharacterized protein n=1 Tax=hydrothermal vent metagenome TaxID=652676 RepID=A0A1W1E0S6_9ZZZZ